MLHMKSTFHSGTAKKTGSTDFGNVLYEIPGSCIRIAFTKPDAQPHSQEYLEAGKTDKAHDAICYAAKLWQIHFVM